MKVTGSSLFVTAMKKEGVDTIFAYPGGYVIDLLDELYDHPCHPYTRMLFDSILTDEEKETTDSVTVNEILPETVDGDGGCPFYGRCRYTGENCLSEVPTLTDIGTPGHPHLVRCERIAYGEKYTAAD